MQSPFYSVSLQAGIPARFPYAGRYFVLDSTGAARRVSVTLELNGQTYNKMPDRGPGFSLPADFDAITLESSANTTVQFFASFEPLRIGEQDGLQVSVPDGVKITNEDINSLPVKNAEGVPIEVANPTGQRLNVDIGGGTITVTADNVGINNTTANPIPVLANYAATVTNGAAASCTDIETAIVAASTSRRGLRIKNAGANPVAIGGTGIAYATAAVILQAGETWNENEAPGAAWYSICGAGLTSTLHIQTIA